MAIPSKAKQIAEVVKLLDWAGGEDVTLEELATRVVEGYHRLLKSGIKNAPPPPYVGLAFKTPWDSKTYHVAWTDGYRMWFVSSDSRYGWFGQISDFSWDYVEESRAKAGAPGNNPDWTAGDKVSRNQRMFSYEVIATGDKCVLLQDQHGSVVADSNDNMKKHYRRETFEW